MWDTLHLLTLVVSVHVVDQASYVQARLEALGETISDGEENGGEDDDENDENDDAEDEDEDDID